MKSRQAVRQLARQATQSQRGLATASLARAAARPVAQKIQASALAGASIVSVAALQLQIQFLLTDYIPAMLNCSTANSRRQEPHLCCRHRGDRPRAR